MEVNVEEVKKSGILKIDGLRLTGVPNRLHTKLAGAKINLLCAPRNHFTAVDQSFAREEFSQLESLELTQNKISVIQEDAVTCFAKSLRQLDLSYNMLGTDECAEASNKECMSESVNLIARLTCLTKLDLSHNSLSQLPVEMEKLVNLNELYVNHNVIVKLPSSLFTLKDLRTLNASNNAITSLAPEIGDLANLENLDISNNNVRRLPPEIRKCEHLRTLCLRGNPWLCPQARICERGKDAVFRELEQLESTRGDAGKCTLVDVRNVVVGENWKCTVIASDANGVPRVAGGDRVSATLEGPASASVKVSDQKDGTYTLEAKLEMPGRYELRVVVEDGNVPMCPVAINAWPKVDPNHEKEDVDAVPVPDEEKPKSGYGTVASAASYRNLRAMCRQHNAPLEVPEFVVCGCDGYEQLVEAVWGIRISSDLFRGQLFRPVQINFMHEDLSAPRVTIKRDVLLGKATTGGSRDIVNIGLEDIGKYIQERNTVVSPVPIVIQIDTNQVLNSTVIIAPALPAKDHPARAQLEYIIGELLKVSRREVICVLPCMDWKLVQTLPWIPRVQQADPSLRRSLFVFSGLSQLLTTLFCPADLAEWLRGKPANIRGYFVSLLSEELYADSKTNEAVYKKRLWQLCARDMQTMDALQCDTHYERFIGINALRDRVMSHLIAAYQKQVPILEQHLTAHIKHLTAETDRVNHEIETLKDEERKTSFLRVAASLRCTEFCNVVKDTLHGTTEAKPLEYGLTLEEELNDLAERRPELISCDRDTLLEESAGVVNRGCRLYGGAQLVRVLEMFKASTAAAVKGKPVSSVYPESKSVAEACENAQRQARIILTPLIDRLCDSTTQAVNLIADVAVAILDSRQAHGRTLIGSPDALARSEDCEGLCMSLLPHLFEFSYLSRSVMDIFVEKANGSIAEFQKRCIADLLVPLSEFSLPSVDIQGDVSELADKLFCTLVKNCTESVSIHFFSTLLQEIVVNVPNQIHSMLMSLEPAHLTRMFKLEALNNALSAEKSSLADELSSAQQKQQDARNLVL